MEGSSKKAVAFKIVAAVGLGTAAHVVAPGAAAAASTAVYAEAPGADAPASEGGGSGSGSGSSVWVFRAVAPLL